MAELYRAKMTFGELLDRIQQIPWGTPYRRGLAKRLLLDIYGDLDRSTMVEVVVPDTTGRRFWGSRPSYWMHIYGLPAPPPGKPSQVLGAVDDAFGGSGVHFLHLDGMDHVSIWYKK